MTFFINSAISPTLLSYEKGYTIFIIGILVEFNERMNAKCLVHSICSINISPSF